MFILFKWTVCIFINLFYSNKNCSQIKILKLLMLSIKINNEQNYFELQLKKIKYNYVFIINLHSVFK